MTRPHCEWKEDFDGEWNTTCGNSFYLSEGKPSENLMLYCCFCGALLDEVPYKYICHTEEEE